jgi:hypothetical protein
MFLSFFGVYEHVVMKTASMLLSWCGQDARASFSVNSDTA